MRWRGKRRQREHQKEDNDDGDARDIGIVADADHCTRALCSVRRLRLLVVPSKKKRGASFPKARHTNPRPNPPALAPPFLFLEGGTVMASFVRRASGTTRDSNAKRSLSKEAACTAP